jgi:hypothetical protein
LSVDLPAFHAGRLMVKARKILFKQGWKQMQNGRIDCIEKTFGNVVVGTIWAGDQLLLNPRKKGYSENSDSMEAYVPLDAPEIQQAINELVPIFDKIVTKNKKRWDKEIKEYEKLNNLTFRRNKKYEV